MQHLGPNQKRPQAPPSSNPSNKPHTGLPSASATLPRPPAATTTTAAVVTAAAGLEQFAAPKMAAIFIGNVNPKCTDKDLQILISNAGLENEMIDIYEINTRANSNKVFKAMVPQDHQDKVIAYLSSNDDLRVEKWRPRKPRTPNNGGGNNRQENFRGPLPYTRGPQPQPGGWNPRMPPFWGPPPPPMWHQQPPNYNY